MTRSSSLRATVNEPSAKSPVGRFQEDTRTPGSSGSSGSPARPTQSSDSKDGNSSQMAAAPVDVLTTTGEHHIEEANSLTPLRSWLRLLACSNVIEGRVRTLLREQFDTTLPRFDLLAQLESAASDSVPGLTMSELSRRMMVTNGNITSLVDRLAREHLISRAVSATDRRTQIVRITETGRKALAEITPDHQRWITSMFAGLSDSECTQLYALLGKLKQSAQSAETTGTSHDE